MIRVASLGLIALLAVGCAGPMPSPPPSPAPSAAPTAIPAPTPSPVIIYVTPSPSPASLTHDIRARLHFQGSRDSVNHVGDNGCEGDGGYDDLRVGLQFDIKNTQGDLVAYGTFTQSEYGTLSFECYLTGTATGVPDQLVYVVEIGRRGAVNFTRADLAGNAWTAELNIGG
ncbi:MAG TPA: hypothetical protein DCQ64_14020 [Candidatus Rokubacteria bacterium]|nr:hypothetical protein [Candidatus Rokubacteria bacterium]